MKTNYIELPDNSRSKELAGLPLASFSRRALALLIDFIIAGIILSLLIYVGSLLMRSLGMIDPDTKIFINFTFFRNWYSVVWLVIYFTFFVYWFKGLTPGKMICKIRIVSTVHHHVSLFHSFERALGYGASALEFGFGFFQYFIRKDKRTVHDRIAETVVIDNRIKKNKTDNELTSPVSKENDKSENSVK